MILGAVLIVLAILLVVVLVRAGRTESPVLLDESSFAGVESADHETETLPNWSSCPPLAHVQGDLVAATHLSFGGSDWAGAAIKDGSPYGVSADANLQIIEIAARSCFETPAVSGTGSMEPLTGLDADAIGWRYEWSDDEVEDPRPSTRAAFVAIKLDEWRVLTVGYEARESPTLLNLDIDDLVRLAREGAAQFEPDQD